MSQKTDLFSVVCCFAVVDVARSVEPVEGRCGSIHHLVPVLHCVGSHVCRPSSRSGADVRPICVRVGYSRSECHQIDDAVMFVSRD
jgi:hypothetical protein